LHLGKKSKKILSCFSAIVLLNGFNPVIYADGSDHPPMVVKRIVNQTVILGQSNDQIDLSPIFNDVDGDVLKYTAVSTNIGVSSVSVSGSQLTLIALSPGTSRIQVSADDGRLGRATTSFNLTVSAPPNQPPVVANAISNQSATVGAGNVIVDLSNVFTDADGDALTLSATSGTTTVATTSVTGNALTLTPLSAGTSTITVTADDGVNTPVDTTFVVTVNPVPPLNHPPTVANAISNQSATVGAGNVNVDLSHVFTDADGDPLTLSANSGTPTVATASVTGNALTLTPLSAGTSTITVTANDGVNTPVSTTFTVTVNPAPPVNHAPTVVSAINEQILTSGVTNPRTYDLTQLFSDDDGDTLQYTATAADSNFVGVSVNGNQLTLLPGIKAGSTTVTVTADDGKGGVTPYTFTVRTAPLVTNGRITVHTKQGVKDPLVYDLSSLFPGQTDFKLYTGTADSTFTGPNSLSGTTLPLIVSPLYTWVVGSDGKAAVIQVIADPQGASALYLSQYLDGGDGRIALQLYYDGDGNPADNATGYELDVYKWNKKTNQMMIEPNPIDLANPNTPYIVIDSIFYDFMDIANGQFTSGFKYYNFDTMLYDPTNYNVVAYVLKKNGQIVDVLGDPNSHNQFMPNGGTIVRKSGIWSGSQAFSEAGEWNKVPLTYNLIGQHTP
jgi:hypothetical protein